MLAAQRLQPGAFRFASAGFPPYLPLLPVPCGRRQRVACPLQTRSEISPTALRLFPALALFSPDAGGNLQILPRITPVTILVQAVVRSPMLRAHPRPRNIVPRVR